MKFEFLFLFCLFLQSFFRIFSSLSSSEFHELHSQWLI
jgi:hypothetical protein